MGYTWSLRVGYFVKKFHHVVWEIYLKSEYHGYAKITKDIKACSPILHRTNSNKHTRIAIASHMSPREICVETMLVDPQENDISQLHHVIMNEDMFGICKVHIQLTQK